MLRFNNVPDLPELLRTVIYTFEKESALFTIVKFGFFNNQNIIRVEEVNFFVIRKSRVYMWGF